MIPPLAKLPRMKGEPSREQRSTPSLVWPRDRCYSFGIPDNGPDTVKVEGKTVILPKIGRVAMVEELRFDGSIREVSINRTAGTWFACFCVEDGQELPAVKDGPTVGVDVGVGAIAVCSDGRTVANPKALAVGLKRLRRLDKAIARSRNVHGRSNHSSRREQLYARRRRLHARVVNTRNDHHHKATTAIAKSAGPGGCGDVECGGNDEPPAGPGYSRCRHGGFSRQAGVQVPVVRSRVPEGGQVVPVVKALLALRLEERRPHPVWPGVVVLRVPCVE